MLRFVFGACIAIVAVDLQAASYGPAKVVEEQALTCTQGVFAEGIQTRLLKRGVQFEDHDWYVVVSEDADGDPLNQLAARVRKHRQKIIVLLAHHGADQALASEEALAQLDFEIENAYIIHYPEYLLDRSETTAPTTLISDLDTDYRIRRHLGTYQH